MATVGVKGLMLLLSMKSVTVRRTNCSLRCEETISVTCNTDDIEGFVTISECDGQTDRQTDDNISDHVSCTICAMSHRIIIRPVETVVELINTLYTK